MFLTAQTWFQDYIIFHSLSVLFHKEIKFGSKLKYFDVCRVSFICLCCHSFRRYDVRVLKLACDINPESGCTATRCKTTEMEAR